MDIKPPSDPESKENHIPYPRPLTRQQWVDFCVGLGFSAVTFACLISAFGVAGTMGLIGLYLSLRYQIRNH